VCVFASLYVIGATVIDYTYNTQVEEVGLRKKERKKKRKNKETMSSAG